MGLTNFPYGISSFGIPIMNGILPSTQGKVIHVKPYSGSDDDNGTSPDKAVKTLVKALALATADKNDIVLLYSESNTAGSTTDYQSSTLDWNKDHVHLIGVNGGPFLGHRSRVALISTYTTASNLFTLSADGCIIANIEFFAGVASANPTGCMKVTGMRNRIENCQISGIGHASMDIAGAYSLQLSGSGASENYFKNCFIGLDTIARGSAANYEIHVTGTTSSRVARTIFDDCVIAGLCESAGNYVFLSCDSGCMDRFIIFRNCIFTNPGTSVGGGVAMTYAMTVTSANGKVILHNTSITGAADVANDPGTIVSNAPVVGAATDLSITQVVVKG